MSTGTANSDGIVFGPTGAGTMYISLYYHRPTAARRAEKNQWNSDFPPPFEYALYELAEIQVWVDNTGHYWGVHNNGTTVLGSLGQRIAKFPRPSNMGDPRHGYPVSPQQRGDPDTPPEDLVEQWIDANVVTKTLGRRIQKRKI